MEEPQPMDLLDLIKLTVRRWYVTAPVIALTIAAAVGVGATIRPEYHTSVAIVLVPPTVAAPVPVAGASVRPGNPWPRIGEDAMAQAVQIAVSAHDARGRVRAAGGDPDYEVESVPRSSILRIEVAATAPATALATVDAVTELVHDEVADRQARYGSTPGEQITTQVLDPGRTVTPSRSNVLRLQIVVVATGLLVAAAAAVGFDAGARHLAAARARREGADNDKMTEPPGTRRPRSPADRAATPSDEASPAGRRSAAGSAR